ncbi:hypothetical protein QJS66_14175 [Kocuria rhizophila]|nr:hypothetical protein QJS66_14175 [Kocuria rhizophila]
MDCVKPWRWTTWLGADRAGYGEYPPARAGLRVAAAEARGLWGLLAAWCSWVCWAWVRWGGPYRRHPRLLSSWRGRSGVALTRTPDLASNAAPDDRAAPLFRAC